MGRAHHRHHGQRHQDDGQRQARGDQERHDAVDGAAEVAGHDAQRRADQPAHQRDGQADQRRDAYAVQGAGQDVAAQLVGAQDVVPVAAFAPDGFLQPGQQVLRVRVVRDQVGADQAGQHQQRQHDQAEAAAGTRQAVAARRGGQGRRQDGAHEAARTRGSSQPLIRSAARVRTM
ncbi:hypothetical protein G6F22_018530 [Rhizopus arrhizus]|nr:hypothetical protein G6F22_018530 [Rhizopus arrhizus]